MSKHAASLARFIGLDEETVKQQIVPYLETFTTRQALINHLEELVGPGQSQRSFVESYADERFPVKATPSVKSVQQSQHEQLKASGSVLKPSQSSKKKSKFPSKLPPPRKVEADAFGGAGSVYRKGQEDDSLLRPSHLGVKSGASSGTATPARTATPDADYRSTSQISTPDPVASNSKGGGGERESKQAAAAAAAAAPDLGSNSFTLIPSDEMRLVQQEIALLRGESREDPTMKAKPCFCQGRRHAIHPHVPLCMVCGLILCSIQHPSPLLLPSPPCPSCANPILSTTSRAILLTRLDVTLAALTQDHEEKVRLIQEERQKAWIEKRKEVELFPDLTPRMGQGGGGASSSTNRQATQEYNHFYERRRAIDVAMGRRVEEDAGRKARVIRLGGPPPKSGQKKKGATKKKKQQQQQQEPKGNPAEQKSLPLKDARKEESSDDDDEGEEEIILLDYDEANGNDGPMPDQHDDGFALHATFFAPNLIDNYANPNSASHDQQITWRSTNTMPAARYIPKEQRQSYLEQQRIKKEEEEEQEANESAKRVVPGAATETDDTPASDKKKRGKSKQTQPG